MVAKDAQSSAVQLVSGKENVQRHEHCTLLTLRNELVKGEAAGSFSVQMVLPWGLKWWKLGGPPMEFSSVWQTCSRAVRDSISIVRIACLHAKFNRIDSCKPQRLSLHLAATGNTGVLHPSDFAVAVAVAAAAEAL